MRSTVKDQLDHEIYLTDERWHHICEEHPEMQGYRRQTLETVRRGRRFQDSVRPQVYLYYRDYQGLPHDNTTIVVVVYFGLSQEGTENNFILTAYQIHRRGG
jgi:hypothetical protein